MNRLIDLRPTKPTVALSRSLDLVPVDRGVCPQCGARLIREALHQDALIRGCGYGGTRRVDTDGCPVCFYERVAVVATERPPR